MICMYGKQCDIFIYALHEIKHLDKTTKYSFKHAIYKQDNIKIVLKNYIEQHKTIYLTF